MAEEQLNQASNQEASNAHEDSQQSQKVYSSFEDFLEANPDIKTLYEAHVSGLKSALEKERERNRALTNRLSKDDTDEDKQGLLQRLQEVEGALKSMQETSESYYRLLDHAQTELAVERLRNAVLTYGTKLGVRNLELLATLATSGDWYASFEFDDGKPTNVEAVLSDMLKKYPELVSNLGTPAISGNHPKPKTAEVKPLRL